MQESRVKVVSTYDNVCVAERVAGQYNAMERDDARYARPPRRYYYVRAVSEEQLREAEEWKHLRRHGEERKRLARNYHKVLQPIAEDMAAAMVMSLVSCEQEHLNKLREHGGWLEGYRGHVEGIGGLSCSVLFSGRSEVGLEVTLDTVNESTCVETFENEWWMKSWLLSIKGAASAIENSIIDIVCDMKHLQDLREVFELEEE